MKSLIWKLNGLRWPYRVLNRSTRCNSIEGAKSHGGVINHCLKDKGHKGKHKDIWGGKFRSGEK
jgi:hypothetical protein